MFGKKISGSRIVSCCLFGVLTLGIFWVGNLNAQNGKKSAMRMPASEKEIQEIELKAQTQRMQDALRAVQRNFRSYPSVKELLRQRITEASEEEKSLLKEISNNPKLGKMPPIETTDVGLIFKFTSGDVVLSITNWEAGEFMLNGYPFSVREESYRKLNFKEQIAYFEKILKKTQISFFQFLLPQANAEDFAGSPMSAGTLVAMATGDLNRRTGSERIASFAKLLYPQETNAAYTLEIKCKVPSALEAFPAQNGQTMERPPTEVQMLKLRYQRGKDPEVSRDFLFVSNTSGGIQATRKTTIFQTDELRPEPNLARLVESGDYQRMVFDSKGYNPKESSSWRDGSRDIKDPELAKSLTAAVRECCASYQSGAVAKGFTSTLAKVGLAEAGNCEQQIAKQYKPMSSNSTTKVKVTPASQ